MQLQVKPLQDPLGHTFVIPFLVPSCGCWSTKDLQRVITEPDFIIQGGKEAIYLIRLLESKSNLLIAASAMDDYFVIDRCLENPTAEYISHLLEKGLFISFL